MRRIIIDGNSIGHAAHHGSKLSAGGKQTQAIYGAIKGICKIKRERPDAKMVVLWDGRSWRYDAYAGYKSKRKETQKPEEREEYKRQRVEISRGLQTLGVHQMIAANMEADDLAAILVRRYAKLKNIITLVTGDQDWLQLIGPGVTWEDHRFDRKCNMGTFEEVTECKTVREFVILKCLTGDQSDSIPGFAGIGKVKARQFMEAYGGMEGFCCEPRSYLESRWREVNGGKTFPKVLKDLLEMDEGELMDIYNRNLLLMDLNHKDIPAPVGVKLFKPEFNEEKFKLFCAEHGFHSILMKLEQYVEPFRELEDV